MLVYVCLLLFVFYIRSRGTAVFLAFQVSLCVLLVFSCVRYAGQREMCRFAAYGRGNNCVCGFASARGNELYVQRGGGEVKYALRNEFVESDFEQPVLTKAPLLQKNGRSAYVVSRDFPNRLLPQVPFEVDYLVIGTPAQIPAERLNRAFSFKRMVVAAQVSPRVAQWWRKNYPQCHIVCEDGDFIDEF